MHKNRQLAINLIAQTIAFVVNFGISFFLTPFIIENIGREAYGFVSLGNNFITYATLISTALNSMAGRFITISIHKDDFKKANEYYSSVIIANILIAAVLSVPSVLIVLNLSRIVTVSNSILGDVQALWSFLFANFLFSIVTATFGVLLFAANRVDIQARRNIESNLIRAALLCGIFAIFQPKVWYLGMASLVCTIYLAITNRYSAKRIYPQICLNRKNFKPMRIKELVSSGIWNTVNSVGGIALTELDLLLSNLFISAEAMGTLSIAKTIPNYVTSFVSSIVNAFMPQLTINYTVENKETFIASIKSYMRILLFFQATIYGLLFGFTDVFLYLWLPEGTSDISYIYMLSMITISGCFVSSVSYIMTMIFTVTNRLRFSSVTVICTGLVSFCVTYALLKSTKLGLIAIAGVSVVLVIVRNVFILLPYGAKCVGTPWYTFFPDLLLNVASILASVLVSVGLKKVLLQKYTWMNLILVCMLVGIIVLVLNLCIVLRKEERKQIFEKTMKKIKRME